MTKVLCVHCWTEIGDSGCTTCGSDIVTCTIADDELELEVVKELWEEFIEGLRRKHGEDRD